MFILERIDYGRAGITNHSWIEIMLALVISYYWLIALVVFCLWFKAFWTDETTSKDDLCSWLVLIIGASLWVVVLPFANLELVLKSYSINN